MRSNTEEVKNIHSLKDTILEQLAEIKKYISCDITEENTTEWKRQSDSILFNSLRLFKAMKKITMEKGVRLSKELTDDNCMLYMQFEEYMQDITNSDQDINANCIRVVMDGRKLFNLIYPLLDLDDTELETEIYNKFNVQFQSIGNTSIAIDNEGILCKKITRLDNVIEIDFR